MKNELIRWLQKYEVVENEELNERVKNVSNHEQNIPIIKDYEPAISSKKKEKLNVAYIQSLLFKKYKDPNKFEQMTQDIEVSKSTEKISETKVYIIFIFKCF